MAFREKSAWAMLALMAGVGLWYGNRIVALSTEAAIARPLPIALAFAVLATVGAIVTQVAVALSAPRDAQTPADERERIVAARAGNWSRAVLSAGAVMALAAYLWANDGDLLFHLILGSLIVATLAEQASYLVLLRRPS